MAGTLNGQLWYVVVGTGNDDIDGHLNSNGTNVTTAYDNVPSTGPGFSSNGSDLSIGFDLPDDLYFVVNSDGLSISVNRASTGALLDTLQIGNFNGSSAAQDIVNSLVVDPNSHTVYVGRWGVTKAESGIVAVSYTAAGVLDHNQAYNASQTRLVNGNEAGGITDVRYMDLSNNNQILYYTDNDNHYTTSPFSATNGIYRIDLTNPSAGATLLSNQSQFPTDLSNGLIGSVTADEKDGIIYFTTHQFSSGGASTGQDALWWMPIGGGAATKITLPANALHYAGEWGGLSYDRQTSQLYISDETDPSTSAARHIIQLQMSADGKSVTSTVNTYTVDTLVGHATGVNDPNAYPAGTSFDLLPIISVTGTTTHAAEQGATIDLTTASTSVTDADNNFLASATVQITGGTFSSNETSASDDHLSVNDGGTFKVSGTFAGTNITISYDSATEKLTLSGTDTLAHYQTVLNAVSYNTTGDNPTNYGNNTSRTITWTLSDGAPNVPDGGQNQTTTTLNIDAVNDAPVNHLPSSPSISEDVLTTIAGITITDVDADPANQDITVTFSVAHGTLTINTGVAGGIVAGDITAGASGTNTITLTATQNQINATLANATGLRYQSDLNFNSGFAAEKLHIVTTDNSHTDSAAFPGAQSATDDLSLTVTAVNDNPNLQPDTTTAVSYTENALPTALYATENVDSPLADVDQSANYAAGSIDLQITTGLVSGDRISLTGTRFVIVTGSIQDTANGNAVVGTIGATNATSHVTVSALTTAATPAVVDALIKSFGFDSTSDNPGGGDRTVTLTFNDGGNTGGGGGLTDAVTQTVHVTPVNDAPVSTITPTSYSATEQVNLSLKNNGLAVSDVDGNSGSETVTLSVTEGTLTLGTGTSNVTIDSGNGTNSVTFHGTLAQLNDLLNTNATSTVVYNDNTDTPSASATLTLLIHDNGNTGGGDLSSSDTATINITAVNDAPTALMTTDPYSATEQTALDLKNTGMSVSDADALGAVETATLSVTEGILNVSNGTSGASVSGSGSSSVTITGTLAQINALLNTDGTSTVSYIDGNANPSASATLTLHIDDGGATGTGGALTGNDSSTINITAVNNAPVSTITPTSYSATEQVVLSLKNNGLAVSDVDGNAGSETVTLSVGEGVLNVTAGGSGATVNNSGTNAVTITGSTAQINALLNTDGTSTVNYIDNSNTPAASTTLTLLIHDNGNTGGGDLSSSDTATINIAAVNDAPILAGLGDTPAFTENGAPVLLDSNANSSVSDAELSVSGNHYAGSTLTLARDGGANPDDVFGATGTLDLVDVSSHGENVSLDGGTTFIGTFANTGNGTFSFAFNANATAASIASVMHQIVYSDASDNPPASVQIDFTFSDGNGQPGGQLQGTGAAPGLATASVTVGITQVNDPPFLHNVAATATYAPGSSGVVLSPGLIAGDPDATPPSPNIGIASATVAFNAGFLAGDELFVNLTNPGGFFRVDDGLGGLVTSNISGQTNTQGALLLSGNDTTAHYQSVLDAVAYHSTAADPGNGGADPNRTITWTINDGLTDNVLPLPQTIVHIDVPPTVDLDASGAGTGFTTTYTENAAPIAITAADLSIADPDTAAATSATIVLTNAKAADIMSIAGSLPGGIHSSIDTSVAGQITVHLLNSASLADYQSAVGQIRFRNSSDAPDTTDRDITVMVSETGIDSNIAHATVHVVAVNDPPVNTIPSSMTAAVATATAVAGLSVSDPDAVLLTTSLHVEQGILTVGAVSGGAAVSGTGTATVTLSGSVAQIDATLGAAHNVLYQSVFNFNGIDHLTMTSNDGGGSGIGGVMTDTDILNINVAPQIPAYQIGDFIRPALNLDASGHIILEGAAADAAAAYGVKFLYAGLPANTPFPPVDLAHADFHLV